MNSTKSWWAPLLDIFFPKICAVCADEKATDIPICFSCLSNLSIITPQKGTMHPADMRLQNRFKYQEAFSFLYMSKKGSTNKLLHQIKYKYRKDIALFLGNLFADAIHVQFQQKIDALIAVPIHKDKLKIRGYNQSVLLAECISKKMNIPFYKDALIKSKNTSSQTTKSRMERISNLKESIQSGNIETLRGKRILLIDDVLTTGSTLEACFEALQDIPEVHISVATLALAGD